MISKGIIWAGLAVQDLPAAVLFYRDILGLPLKRQGEGWAHFEAGGGALFELYSGGEASDTPKDNHHQALVIGFLVDDLTASVADLQRRGVKFLAEIDGYRNQRWITFCDPEGNRLELKEIR